VRVVFPESMCAEIPIFRWNRRRLMSFSVNKCRGSGGGVRSVSTAGFSAAAADAALLPKGEAESQLHTHREVKGRCLERREEDTALPSIIVSNPRLHFRAADQLKI
jgi:hypothetical protein